MQSRTLIVIGHSHIRAIQAAAQRSEFANTTHFIDLLDKAYGPAVRQEGDAFVLTQALKDRIRELGVHRDVGFVLSIGGAWHNALGLAKHPEQFHFRNPWKAATPISGVPSLPFRLIERVLSDRASYFLMVLRGLARVLGRPMVQLQAPPPVPSEDAIRQMPGVYAEACNEYGVSDAESRYAWWRIQSDAFSRVAAEEGIEFLQAPPHCVSEEGYLLRKAWRDPTHANSWYGAQVLHQLNQHFMRGRDDQPLQSTS